MSEEATRVPSVDQLVEVHQALWGFHELNTYSWNFTQKQEERILPGFERLADALAPIRQIEFTKGWPTRIGCAVRSIVKAFDATTEAWGWEWISMLESERSAYLTERSALLNRTLDEPILEAALSLADRWADSEHCRFDDLADEARDRGLVPRSMTVEEALAQYREARERFSREPRWGKCYPRVGERESNTLVQALTTLRGELLTIAPDRVERPPWQQERDSAPHPKVRNNLPEAPPIDFDAVAESLLREKQAAPSRLVKFMKDRSVATFQDVMDEVCGGERRETTVRTLVNRTNNHLHDLKSRLSFSTKDSQVIRDIAPE